MACTGQGWEQIRSEWDVPRMDAWSKYTADHPPLHLMVAAYLDIKPASTSKRTINDLPAELARTSFAAMTDKPPRPLRKDLMPWLKKT